MKARAHLHLPACLAALLLLAGLQASALAQDVFDGDPVDSGGAALVLMPGLPLLLPGSDEDFGTSDDVVDTGFEGDIDLVVRSGSISSATIPAPSLAPGGPAITTVEAGGGSTGFGAEAPFTVMVSNGAGTYGSVLASSDLDLRPVTVYAFADLDDDGVIGPTNADGAADNALELQEATAYAGRQMGALDSGRFEEGTGLEIGAPASLGGLTVALVAAAWTGSDPEALFSDGPLVLTRWPFMPPLDPKDVIGGGHPPDPDPTLPNELEWDIERNYLPSPSHPVLGAAFALAVDGSEPTTDQVRVVSSHAVSARVFVEPASPDFLARARPRLRVAPAAGASGRVAVFSPERLVLPAGEAVAVRVLPTDLFGNVADLASPIVVTVGVSGAASIVSPDSDANPKTEMLTLGSAEGAGIVLGEDGTGAARLELSIGASLVQSIAVAPAGAPDFDGDGVADDGNASSAGGDRPCDAASTSCDDNCALVINPSQLDSDHDGLGDCCDGTCVAVPNGDTCGECALPAAPTFGEVSGGRVSVRLGGGVDADKLTMKLSFALPSSVILALDSETVSVALTQGGSAGYAAELAALFIDASRGQPSFRYSDRDGIVDGVIKAKVRRSGDSRWKMTLRATGVSLAELSAGVASLSIALGDDVIGGSFACEGNSPHVSCTPLP